MSPRPALSSWFGVPPEASQGVPASISPRCPAAKLSRCQLLYLRFVGKDKKKVTGKYCQLRKTDFLMGMCYFLLRLPGTLSFPAFVCFTHSKITFQFGIWYSLATFAYVHEKIYLQERSFLANAMFSVLSRKPLLPLLVSDLVCVLSLTPKVTHSRCTESI